MEVLLAVLQLLAAAFGAAKAYFEMRGRRSGEEKDDHTDARNDKHGPKHLRR